MPTERASERNGTTIMLPNGGKLVDLPPLDLNRPYHPRVAAAYLGISTRSVYNRIRAGQLQARGTPIRILGRDIAGLSDE